MQDNLPSLSEWAKNFRANTKPGEPDTDMIAQCLKSWRKAVKGIGWLETENRRSALELVAAELREYADIIQQDIQAIRDWEKQHDDSAKE